MKRYFIPIIAVCLIVVAFAAYLMRHKPISPMKVDPATIAVVGPALQAQGVMSKSDYDELQEVNDRIVDSAGRISDSDLAFILGLLDKPTRSPGNMHVEVLSVLYSVKEMSPSQRRMTLSKVEPLTSFSEDDGDIGQTRMASAAVLGITQDRTAVPYLLPLLNDKYPYVQKQATRALKQLGYSTK